MGRGPDSNGAIQTTVHRLDAAISGAGLSQALPSSASLRTGYTLCQMVLSLLPPPIRGRSFHLQWLIIYWGTLLGKVTRCLISAGNVLVGVVDFVP